MKKVTIISAMHGDEVYGIELFKQFTSAFPELKSYVQLIVGNEEAYRQQKRFIDVDMNRHYRVGDDSYESGEIKRVDQLIKDFQPDYIIDIHTTRRNSGIFFISDTINARRRQIYDMLDIDVCIMKDSVIKQSLIGNYPNAVSLEYSLASISDTTTMTFINSLRKLLIEEKGSVNNGHLYTISKLITKQEWRRYNSLANYDLRPEGMALMVPKDISEMDAGYYGFWCTQTTN